MKATQKSFVRGVKVYTVDTGKQRGTPTADYHKLRGLLLSYRTISVKHRGVDDEIVRASVSGGKCMVLLMNAGKKVELSEVEIIENFGF